MNRLSDDEVRSIADPTSFWDKSIQRLAREVQERRAVEADAVYEARRLRGSLDEVNAALRGWCAIGDRLRELHRTEVMGAIPPESLPLQRGGLGCEGGTRYWHDCYECGQTWPCPTIRLLDGGQ